MTVRAKGGAPAGQTCPSRTSRLSRISAERTSLRYLFIFSFCRIPGYSKIPVKIRILYFCCLFVTGLMLVSLALKGRNCLVFE